MVTIVDTRGEDMLKEEHESYYLSVDGFMVVYSVTSKETLKVAEDIMNRICRLRGGI